MLQTIVPALGVLLSSMSDQVADAGAQPSPAVRQYRALVDEYEKQGVAAELAPKFFQLAEQHPNDPAAVDALLWIVERLRTRPDATRALEWLAKSHVESERLGEACSLVARTPSVASERLLRTLLEKSPHRDVRARACSSLADLLERQMNVVGQLEKQPELTERVIQYYGKDYGKHLASLQRSELTRQQERVYETMRKSFPDVFLNGEKLADVAERGLFRIRHLSVGTTAPEIQGEDVFGKEFKLSDCRGKVVMLSFWGHW